MRSTTRFGKRYAVHTLITTMVAALAIAAAASIGSVAAAPPQRQALELDLAAVDGGPGKPPTPMLDSRLSQLENILRNEGNEAARRFAAANNIALDDLGRARVLIHEAARPDYDVESIAAGADPEQRIGRASFGEEALFAALEEPIRAEVARLGGEVQGRVDNLLDASLPVSNLRALNPAAGMAWVQAAPRPRADVTSEGVNVIKAAQLQNSSVAYQPPDDPVRVGVLDLGFTGYQSLLGTELPSSVTVNSFAPTGIGGGGEVHGTAVAEIVHDVAPDARLFFVNFDSISQNSAAVNWLISQNVDVINYSIGWFNAGPGDGRGPINDHVRRAMDAGIVWVNSAGNEARDHWQGIYSDPDGDGIHNFAPGDESNAVFLNSGEELTVFLNWDDWFASAQDYDLYILDGAGNVVAASENFQTGFQNPEESTGIIANAAGTYHVVITRFSATRDVNLEMFFFVAREMQYIVPAGSLTIPADTDGAVAVGATFWGSDVIEPFSSLGPTADNRIKPDISAPDGVSTVTYNNLGFKFFGTSAAAPHVAGAIALMKSRFGVFSLDDIVEILYGRALDRGVSGMDNTYGRGRLDLIGQ